MKQRILGFLFMRFVPHRTAIGIALLGASQLLETLSTPAFCADWPSVCHVTMRLGTGLGPLLAIAGIRDKDRV